MKITRNLLPIAYALIVFLIGCGRLGWHTSDSTLEKNFALNEKGFELLLAELKVDSKLTMYSETSIHYARKSFDAVDNFSGLDGLGFGKERRRWYGQQLKKLGIIQILSDGWVELKVDGGSIANGDSYKGYIYSPAPPPARRKASLDGYRVSMDDKNTFGDYFVYKPIKSNWYLYLFVNR